MTSNRIQSPLDMDTPVVILNDRSVIAFVKVLAKLKSTDD